MTEQNSKPVKTFRSGNISVSIWAREHHQNGKTIIRHSIKPQKQYKNDKGNWTDTDYYFPEELPRIQALLQKAYDFIMVKESPDTEDIPS